MSRQLIAGRWEVTRSLGQGGMGDVYLGYDLDTDAEVAIKLLKPDVVDAMPDLIERFQREADLLLQLNHPHIVRIIGTVDEDDLHYLVMDYLPGGTLKDMIAAEGALPIERVLNMALDLSDALTRAHRLHIIHRDLKPANVLLADDGSPRLSDFGISRVADSTTLTKSGALVGTINYASPEACQGREITTRSDIWSFGVMLCEMLTGFNPFSREQIAATITAILSAPPPDLEEERPDAPLALIDLIYRMLEKNPDDRISSMRRVGAELEAVLQGDQLAEPGGQRSPRSPAGMIEIDVSPHTPPPPRPVRASLRQHLHAHQTPFVGREGELANIDQLMRNPAVHLINLTAPGGMGKTRLALEYAQRKIGQYTNGVYFVPLAGLSSREDVVLAIADAIRFGFSLMGDREEQLLTFLKDPAEHHMLLVLDNLEHMLDEVVPLINVILRNAPDIHLLTTARVRLNLNSEYVYEVGGMDIPADLETDQLRYHEAVQLFANSARRAQPSFKLKDDDLPHVLRICRSVIGNPLGIVLAAAWTEVLSLEEIADEIQHSFDFLAAEMRDVPRRQWSIQAVFESTWQRLTPGEQHTFIRFAVFRGGCTRQAAQAIAGATPHSLMQLINKSLIWRDNESGRYEIHELLRQYAAAKLDQAGDGDDAVNAHAQFYVTFMADQLATLKRGEPLSTIHAMGADWENITRALFAPWSWQPDNFAVVRACIEAMYLFNEISFRDLTALQTALVTQWFDSASPVRQMLEARFLPLTEEGFCRIEQILDAVYERDDRPEMAFCYQRYAFYMMDIRQDHTAAIEAYEQAYDLYRELDDLYNMAQTRMMAGWALWHDGDKRLRYQREALDKFEQLGNRVRLSRACIEIAFTYTYDLGDVAAGEHYGQRGFELALDIGMKTPILYSRVFLGWLAFSQGDFETARAHVQICINESVNVFENDLIKNHPLILLSLMASITDEDYEIGLQLADYVLTHTRHPVTKAFATLAMAFALFGQGEYDAARANWHSWLARGGARQTLQLNMVALLLARTGRYAAAAEILGCVANYPAMLGWRDRWALAQTVLTEIQTQLGQTAYHAAFERGQQQELATMLAKLREEL